MLSRVLRTIREHQLFAPGERVLIAVSGGPDSTALLEALVALGPRLGLSYEVATVDHGLRPAAAEEAREVERQANARGLVCHLLRADVGAERGRHVSLQDAARRARLAVLEACAEARGLGRIAVGHTADDQAETILFRIVRGTGVQGLRGIPYRRGRWVRPLLDVRRSEVLAYLARRKLSFVSDPSNQDARYTRTRIRSRWLPFLAEENPRIVEALLALGASARGAERVAGLNLAGAPALTRRTAAVVERLIAEGRGTQSVAVSGGEIEISYGRATFRPGVAPRAPAASPHAQAVASPGQFVWPSPLRIAIEVVLREGTPPSRSAIAFDAEIFREGLSLRAPLPGDRMRPRGGRGSRKLQDLFVDAKIPQKQRRMLPALVTAAGTILFVPGLRPAEHGQPSPEARRWVEIRVAPRLTFPATIDPPAAARVDDE